MLEKKYQELIETLEQINKQKREENNSESKKPFLKLIATDVQLKGATRFKKCGRVAISFALYIKKHQISLDDALRYPIYRDPHFLKDSKEFFQAIRSQNLEKVRRMVSKDRLLLFQIDFVRYG